MIIIRPIKIKDLNTFSDFSHESLLGITTLPRDPDKLRQKIAHSETSFLHEIQKPGHEEYYFVLEDLTTGRIGGICGIMAQSSRNLTYFYKIEKAHTHAKHISAPKEIKILHVVTNPCNSSEVCSLYLQPTFRHGGQGRLLSLSRFLFIAAHSVRFEKKFIAEIRGFVDQRQVSPFWDNVGRHFCNLSFVEIMAQIDLDRTFVSEILPEYPIYIPLLSQEAQAVIGKAHDNSKPALAMLQQENFIFNDEVDIFDAGPHLEVATDNIRTIKNSSIIHARLTKDPLSEEKEFLLGNEKLDFRSCYGRLQLISDTEACINCEVADALHIKDGDPIRFVTTR